MLLRWQFLTVRTLFGLSVLFTAPFARAEGEDQNPALNGKDSPRWVLMASTRDSGKSLCRYAGGFADKDTAYKLNIKVVTRKSESRCAETLLNLSDAPDLTFDLDLSARTMSDHENLCDDARKRFRSTFGKNTRAHRDFCRSLAEREFDRGMRRCLAIANRAINRAATSQSNSSSEPAPTMRSEDPTQSYCVSLLPLAGRQFESWTAKIHGCDTPFQALRFAPFHSAEALGPRVLQGIFGGASARLVPLLRGIHDACDQSP